MRRLIPLIALTLMSVTACASTSANSSQSSPPHLIGGTPNSEPYADPRHPGDACHDFVIFGIVGQSCSNF